MLFKIEKLCTSTKCFVGACINRCIRSEDIQAKARELYTAAGGVDGGFNASNGWLERFKSRQAIASRRITGYAQKIPKELPALAQMFWDRIAYEGKAGSKLLTMVSFSSSFKW